MYNLLMSGDGEALRGEPWTLARNRLFEYTDEDIRVRFYDLSQAQITEICRFPALIAYEKGVTRSARIGRIVRVRVRDGEVRIDYSFASGLPEIPSDRIQALEWELGLEEYERNRTHWALKDIDLGAELISAGIITGDQVEALPPEFRSLFSPGAIGMPVQVQPKIFRVPAGKVEADLVSVMLPFRAEFTSVFDALRQAGEGLGLRVHSANSVWEEAEIIQDIFSLIYRSKVVICDFSDRNPNVFYEAGIAHTLGRPVIPIVQNVDDIPFDLRHHRHIIYLNNAEGRQALLQELTPRLRALSQQGRE